MSVRIIPMALLLLGTACATAGAARDVTPDARLAKALAGKVAGPPRTCLSTNDTRSSTTYRDAILYRVSSKLTYLNDLGKCPFMRDDNILVTRVYGSQICRGDIVNMVSRAGGFLTGSCVFSDFVPYRSPGK